MDDNLFPELEQSVIAANDSFGLTDSFLVFDWFSNENQKRNADVSNTHE